MADELTVSLDHQEEGQQKGHQGDDEADQERTRDQGHVVVLLKVVAQNYRHLTNLNLIDS